jgi:hypothetical protein
MKFLRMVSPIALAVALTIGLVSVSEAAVLDSVVVVTPDSGGLRGIDSLVTVDVYTKTSVPSTANVAVFAWLALPGDMASEIPDTSNTAMIPLSSYPAITDSVGFAQRDSFAPDVSKDASGTVGDEFVAGRVPLDWPSTAVSDIGDLVSAEVHNLSNAIGFRWRVRMVFKIGAEISEHAEVSVWAAVYDQSQKKPDDPLTTAQEFQNGFTPPRQGQGEGTGLPNVFAIDGDRPTASTVIIEGVILHGATYVKGFTGGTTYAALGAGDTIQLKYDLGSDADDILFRDYSIFSELYYKGDTTTVDLGLVTQKEDSAYWVLDPVGQPLLKTNLTVSTVPGILGVFLADGAGNLSSSLADDPNPSGLTQSASFVVDLSPPDIVTAESTAETIFWSPLNDGKLTDGDIVGDYEDSNPLVYRLNGLEDLSSLEFAFTAVDAASPTTEVGGASGTNPTTGCNGPCGQGLPAEPVDNTDSEIVFDAAISRTQSPAADGTPDYPFMLAYTGLSSSATVPDTIRFGATPTWGDTTGVFDLHAQATDLAGNVWRGVVRTKIELDSVEPTFNQLFPLSCALVDTVEELLSAVKFRLSEPMSEVLVTYTKKAGADVAAYHVRDLNDSQLIETEARQPFTFDDKLVDLTTYALEVFGRDLAGNVAVRGGDTNTLRYDKSYQVPQASRFVIENNPATTTSISAGATTVLTVTACDEDRRALGYEDAFTDGQPRIKVDNGSRVWVRLQDGTEHLLEDGKWLMMDEQGWECGQVNVTLWDFAAPEVLTVTVIDSARTVYPTGLLEGLKTVPHAYAQILVDAPDTVAAGSAFPVTLTLADMYGNALDDVGYWLTRYVTLAANQLGIELPPGEVLINNGMAQIMAKSVGPTGTGLVISATDLLDLNDGNHPDDPGIRAGASAAVTVTAGGMAVDAPDTLVAVDYMGANGLGDQGGFVSLTWDISADHAGLTGYRIYRELMVDTRAGVGTEPAIVILETAVPEFVPWAIMDAVPGETIGRAIVATLDNVGTLWAVAAEISGSSSATTAKEAFDGVASTSTAYELMASTMVESKQAVEQLVDGPVFATLTPEALAFVETGIVPQMKTVDELYSSILTPTANAVRGIDNIAPDAVAELWANDTPSDAGASITLAWSQSVSEGLVARSVPNAVGGSLLSDQVQGVMGYNILRSVGGEFTLVGQAQSGQTTFADVTANNGVRYTYQVRPYDADNEALGLVERSAMAIRNNVKTPEGVAINGLFGADNTVGFDDFFLFADNFGLTDADLAFEPAFDLVANAKVDFEDFFLFADSFGKVANVAGKIIPTMAGLNTDARLYLDAGSELPSIGGEVAIQVDLSDYAEMKGFGLNVSYDAEVLEFVRIASESSLLGSGELATPQVIAESAGEVAVAAYGETVSEGALDLSLVFRTKTEIENTYVEVTESELRDGNYAVNQIALPAPVQIQTRPEAFALANNYPNPFNPATTIKYALPEAAFVQLAVYNVVGQVVRTLVADQQNAGRYVVQWDANNDSGHSLSSGIYFYRILAGSEFLEVKKMLLLK